MQDEAATSSPSPTPSNSVATTSNGVAGVATTHLGISYSSSSSADFTIGSPLSVKAVDSSSTSSASSTSSLSPHLRQQWSTAVNTSVEPDALSTPDSGFSSSSSSSSSGGAAEHSAAAAALGLGLMTSPLLASLSPSPSTQLWSSTSSSSCSSNNESNCYHLPTSPTQRRPITGSHHLSPSLVGPTVSTGSAASPSTGTSVPTLPAGTGRSGPSSPSNFLLPGVINANKSPASSTFSSPWSNVNGSSSSSSSAGVGMSPNPPPGTLSPSSSSGLWNRAGIGRSAPNLAHSSAGVGGVGGGGGGGGGGAGGGMGNPLGHGLNSAFTAFPPATGSPWAPPANTPIGGIGRKNNMSYGPLSGGGLAGGGGAAGMSNPAAGFYSAGGGAFGGGGSRPAPGGGGGGGGGSGGGGGFRRSTSYPGKNNVFGSTQFHMAPPTLEVTNIDENSDYIYQDGGGHLGGIGGGGGGGGSMGPSALDNMRSLEYYLHDMMHNPHDGHDPCKGKYYSPLDGSEMNYADDANIGMAMGLSAMTGLDCFGMNGGGGGGGGGGSYLPSLSIHSQSHCMSSPSSRISPRSPVSTSGSESGERYSRKVFVGGLPPDIDEEEINASFRRFGSLVVDWPHKAESKSYFPPKGYAFLLFQEEQSVQKLIESCIQEEDKLYLCVSSPTIKDKPVQIRPWKLSDADVVLDDTLPLDPRKTVFVGGVPRPLKAVELALIMDRLYGGVCYAGIDIDPELKYPKGAGRVAFSNQQSYIAAISARFVQLQHGDIDKRVEVKPYVLDDQFCDECQGTRSAGRFAPFFCANVTCLLYYCEHCWAMVHSRPGREFHKPLVKEGADRPRTVHFRW